MTTIITDDLRATNARGRLIELPRRWELILTLARRELARRYRGSVLGVTWVILTPIVMIAIYTFIFAEIFGARFGAAGSPLDYALYLFCGLLPWTSFQESLQASANVVVTNASMVKRVRFPLETLPLAQTLAAAANQLFGTVALVVAALIVRRGEVHLLTLLWLPALLIPQLLLSVGGAWLVASLGVFWRDTAQTLSLILVAWLYLTPIVYPESVVPARYRQWIALNPLAPLVRSYRHIVLDGRAPDWGGMLYFTVFAVAVFLGGWWWFARTRKGFADVL